MRYEITFKWADLEVVETFTCIPRVGEYVWLNFRNTLMNPTPYNVSRVDYMLRFGQTTITIYVVPAVVREIGWAT